MISATQWVVLELTSKAEGEDPDVVRASIRHHIRDAEVFVPASVVQRGDVREYHYLVDGYAFVLHKHPDPIYNRLEDTKYVLGPLYRHTGSRREKRLATVSSTEIDKFRSQIKVEVDQGIEVGDTVAITSGPYKNISAQVREEIPEHDSVVVHIQLRSTDRLVTLPRAFLRLETKSPTVIYRDRFENLTQWIRAAQSIVSWRPPNIDKMLNKFNEFYRWDRWLSKSLEGYRFLRACRTELSFQPALDTLARLELLLRATHLRDRLLLFLTPLPDLSAVTSRQLELAYLDDVFGRVMQIYSELRQMDQRKDVPVNLVIDGTQLFIRCAEAPGLGALVDSKGRSTGPIVGFLRSLGSYRKRFPGAVIYVCWDGSSQRRKMRFPEYKANRVSRSGAPSFGIEFLRDALPLLGVQQAWHPEEEADDVIATLVRGPLKDQPNVIVTTDRDMLQLVSETTHQLCPAVGAGKEKLYDPALVETDYGVPPKQLVHVRALSGDSSDNIPGVPNFGLKTAAKVVKLYGTVGAVLGSNLAGLGKAQVENLRRSASQVQLNVELLALCDVAFRHIESNPNQTEVEVRLRDLEIKPDQILTAFFPHI